MTSGNMAQAELVNDGCTGFLWRTISGRAAMSAMSLRVSNANVPNGPRARLPLINGASSFVKDQTTIPSQRRAGAPQLLGCRGTGHIATLEKTWPAGRMG